MASVKPRKGGTRRGAGATEEVEVLGLTSDAIPASAAEVVANGIAAADEILARLPEPEAPSEEPAPEPVVDASTQTQETPPPDGEVPEAVKVSAKAIAVTAGLGALQSEVAALRHLSSSAERKSTLLGNHRWEFVSETFNPLGVRSTFGELLFTNTVLRSTDVVGEVVVGRGDAIKYAKVAMPPKIKHPGEVTGWTLQRKAKRAGAVSTRGSGRKASTRSTRQSAFRQAFDDADEVPAELTDVDESADAEDPLGFLNESDN